MGSCKGIHFLLSWVLEWVRVWILQCLKCGWLIFVLKSQDYCYSQEVESGKSPQGFQSRSHTHSMHRETKYGDLPLVLYYNTTVCSVSTTKHSITEQFIVHSPGKWSECERYSFTYLRTRCQHQQTTSMVRHLPLGLPQTNTNCTNYESMAYTHDNVYL